MAKSSSVTPVVPRRRTWLRRQLSRRRRIHRINEDSDYTTFVALTQSCKRGVIFGLGAGRFLLALTVVAIASGAILGLAFANKFGRHPLPIEHQYLEFPGRLFLRMLQVLTVPLVISSNVSSAATVTSAATRRLGMLSLLFYLATTVAAIVIGMAFALALQPGTYNRRIPKVTDFTPTLEVNQALFSTMDLIRNLVPDNIVQATFERSKTNYHRIPRNQTAVTKPETAADAIEILRSLNATGDNATLASETTAVILQALDNLEAAKEEKVPGPNILGLICFSLFFGFGLRKVQEVDAMEVEGVLLFFTGLRKIMVYLVSIVIWFSPIGILSLIASEVSKTDDIGESMKELAMYSVAVSAGLAVHLLVVLLPCCFFLGRKNPLGFFYDMLQALMVACGTASSMATLPATASCLENNVKLDLRVMRFMLPLGTTVNMDGTAVYQMVALIYLAQGMDMPLGAEQVVFMMVLTLISSIVTTSVPSGGVITMMITMQAMGMPTEHIEYVMAVDWLLDRLRTPVNVISNALGVAVVAEWCRHSLHAFGVAKPEPKEDEVDEDGKETADVVFAAFDQKLQKSLKKTKSSVAIPVEDKANEEPGSKPVLHSVLRRPFDADGSLTPPTTTSSVLESEAELDIEWFKSSFDSASTSPIVSRRESQQQHPVLTSAVKQSQPR